jgi:hypothetical protein
LLNDFIGIHFLHLSARQKFIFICFFRHFLMSNPAGPMRIVL